MPCKPWLKEAITIGTVDALSKAIDEGTKVGLTSDELQDAKQALAEARMSHRTECNEECADFDSDARGDITRGKQTSVKCVFSDFDQTISRCHVFKQLGGLERPMEKNFVPQPFAKSERGQISKIGVLNALGPCR